MPCPGTQHQNNDVTALRTKKRDISPKMLHQSVIKIARLIHSATVSPLRHIVSCNVRRSGSHKKQNQTGDGDFGEVE